MGDRHGWTPIIEPLARERGLVSAAVFGIVQRHCKMANGVCDASLETMAEMIGSERSTVLRHIKKLCEDGYLKDLTPTLRNSPHIYEDTGKVELMVKGNNVSDKSVVMRNSLDNGSDNSVAHNNSSTPTVAHSNSSKDGSDNSVAESHLKRESLNPIESKPIESEEESGKPPPPPIEYTPFLRGFLDRFSAKRFRNPTQYKTVSDLTATFGEAELSTLAEWAANKGMGLGQAIPAIKSALTKPQARTNGHHGTSQNLPRPDAQRETTGPPTTAEQLTAAWERKSRAGRDPT